jgi:anti-sigma factor RsiW
MNITNDIINDLIPLYVANECSADTRALVEEHLLQNPRQAEELRRIMQTPVAGAVPPPKALLETQAFREARKRMRIRSALMALAIFFTLSPFSFVSLKGQTWMLARDEPKAAAVYFALGVGCWIAFAMHRRQSSIV